MQAYKKVTDIYIKPDIEKYSVLSFNKGKEIIKIGEEAGFSVFEQLKSLSTQHQALSLAHTPTTLDSLLISKIITPKLENFTRAYIIGRLGFKENTKVTYDEIKKGIENLNATQNFNIINYAINKDIEHKEGDVLEIILSENPVRTFLKFGLHYDGLYKSGLLVNLTQKRLLLKNDVFSADVVLGDNFRYKFDYYIDNGFYWSFGLRSFFNQFNRNIGIDFNNGLLLEDFGISTINVDYSDYSNQIYLQTVFNRKFIIGAGFEHRHIRVESKTLENIRPIFDDSDYYSVFGYLKFDSFDNKYFPKTGGLFNGEIKSFVYSTDFTKTYSNFTIAKANFAVVKTIFKKISLKLQSEGGFAIGQETVPFFDFTLGGYGFYNYNNFRPFFGYDFLSIAGNSYVKGIATADWEFLPKQHLNLTANYANIGKDIFETTNWFTQVQHSGYAVGYGIETIIGPLEIKHSWSPEIQTHYTWFNIGFSF
jgi:NTE family protein